MRSERKKAYKRGHFAETLACLMLMVKGYTILERRYKSKVGEIDIIARKNNVTAFCEVKARKDYQTAAESVGFKQKERISRAAEHYMSHLKTGHKNNKIESEIYRCDVILVLPWQWPVHIENAW